MLTTLLALALVAADPAPAPPLEVLFHADLEGRLAQPRCGAQAPAVADYAALAGTLQRLRREAREAGRLEPVTLLGGDELGPDLFARHWVEREPDKAPAAMAALFAQAGYDAIALGNHDLELGAVPLTAFLEAFAAAHLPVVATNLHCTGAGAPLCAHTVPELLLTRGDLKVGVLAVMSPGILKAISAAAGAGLTLDELLPSVKAGMQRLRAQGAQKVLVVLQVASSDAGLTEVRALQLGLQGPDAPDLLLTSGLADAEGTGAVRFLRTDHKPSLVGSALGTESITRAVVGPDGVDAHALEVHAEDASLEARAVLVPQEQAYCDTYGAPIGSGQLKHPLIRDDLVKYALEVLRRRMGAEVALLNRKLMKREAFPLESPLVRAGLYRAMPYGPRMGVAVMSGAQLRDVVGPALPNPLLASIGMDSPTKVNGRDLDPTRSYRVATIDFVAEGGDGIFAKGALPFEPADGTDLRAAIEQYMAHDAASQDGDPTIDPDTDFGPPGGERLLLVGIGDLELDFTDTTINNPNASYPDAQLTRDQSRAFKGQAVGQLQLRHPLHTEDTVLTLKYGYARTEPAAAPSASGETADSITLSSIYGHKGLRKVTNTTNSPWMPDPYARAFFESEFTKPDLGPTQPRTWHHAELSATLGALLSPTSTLKLRGGAGFRKELLASKSSPNPDEVDVARIRFLAEAGAALTPLAIATVGKLTIKVEGTLDYAFLDPTGITEHQVKGSGKLSMPLLPALFFTAGLDVFAVRRNGQPWGTSYDSTVGLKLHWDGARQDL